MGAETGPRKPSFWPAETAEPLLDSTVGTMLVEAARSSPSAPALVANSVDGALRRWSFEQLLEDAERVARALLACFEPGERVAVWSPNVSEFFLLQLGIAVADMVLVPVPLALHHQELRHILGQSGAAGIFLVPDHRGVAMVQTLDDVRPSSQRFMKRLIFGHG